MAAEHVRDLAVRGFLFRDGAIFPLGNAATHAFSQVEPPPGIASPGTWHTTILTALSQGVRVQEARERVRAQERMDQVRAVMKTVITVSPDGWMM